MTDWAQVTAAIGTALGGDRDGGRRELDACWRDTDEGHAAQRCVLAHYLADVQDDLAAEVGWDEQALAAYAQVGESDLAAVGIPSAVGLAPSLHLNLADGYLRQGRVADARAELEAGLATVDALGDDGYGAMIRNGLFALEGRLTQAESAG